MDIFKNVPLEKSKLPKNVKQIGEVEDDISIYIEDYVYTYLYQYAKTDLSGEKVALLVGEKFKYNDQDVILISGAIKGKDVKKEDGNFKFEKTTWEHVEESLNNYFKDKIMLGWVDSQPGYGIFMTGNHIDIQNKYFREENQVLYLIDPIERNDGFFIWKNERLVRVKGFFIYYERNKDMHEYMLNNKIEIEPEPEQKEEKKITLNSIKQDVVSKYRKHDKENKEISSQKNIIKMLSSLSMVLFIVCLVIGFGLITCVDRINKLEQSATNVSDNEYELSQTLNNDVSSLDDIGNDLSAAVNAELDDQEFELVDADTPEEQSDNTNEDKEQTSNDVVDNNEVEDVFTDAIVQGEEETVVTNEQQFVEYDVPNVYVVQSGDSLNGISMEFYNTTNMVNKILQLNDLDNPNRITIGQILKLPKSNK